MQLILDTEATIDIKEKMSTFEDSLEKDLKTPESLKNDITNGNKENINSKENLIKNSENVINGIDKDVNIELSTIQPTQDRLENEEEKEIAVVNKNEQNNSEEYNRKDETTIDSIEDNVTTNIDNQETSLSKNDKEIDIEHLETVGIKSSICSNVLSSNQHKDNSNVDTDLSNGISKCETSELKDKDEPLKDSLEPNRNCLNDSERAEHVEELLKNTINEKKLQNISDQVELIDQGTSPVETSLTINHIDSNESNIVTSKTKLTDQEVLAPESENGSTIADATIEPHTDIIECDEIKDTSGENNMECDESEHIKSDVDVTTETEERNMDCEDIEVSKDVNNIKEDNLIEDNTEVKVVQEIVNVECHIKSDMDITTETEERNMDCADIEASKDVNNIKEDNLIEDDTEVKVVQEIVSVECEDSKNNSDKNMDSMKSGSIVKSQELLNIDEIEVTEVPEKKELNKTEPTTISDENIIDCDNSENISKTESIVQPEEARQTDVTELEPSKNDVIEKMECDIVENNVEADNIVDVDEVKESNLPQEKMVEAEKKICKLSNTLDILSDDEDTAADTEPKVPTTEKQCINIEDDDDIMLIDEDLSSKESKQEPIQKVEEISGESTVNVENSDCLKYTDSIPKEEVSSNVEIETSKLNIEKEKEELAEETKEEPKEESIEKPCPFKPLLPENFLKSYKKNLTDMTREELEEFCILKIVESIVDRSNLSDIKSKLKAMSQNIEEYKKKAMMLSKQNRDLQVVLKSIQEEQKKKSDTAITPLKITRSVGMQVIMQEKIVMRKKPTVTTPTAPNNKNVRTPNQSPKQQKPPAGATQQIPVPRLIPAHGQAVKPVNITPVTSATNTQNKTPSPVPNGVRPPAQKAAEKRPHSRLQSVTVDLTDDEPPSKVPTRVVPAPPVRLVSPQNLLAPQRLQFSQNLSSPRKVYIPISGPQSQSIRPGQTIMLKSIPGPRQRCPTPQLTRMPQQTSTRMTRVPSRHPAPLPDAHKQYQPPNWKALPPAPDLKLSKVENGIVISWKIDGYQEDSYEEIASYQLYAYQETASPPSTALWKKIGDVKALPLPMACTLTQFMAGFKYYFAVRAVDVRSRLGPFSLPGSILLLSKM